MGFFGAFSGVGMALGLGVSQVVHLPPRGGWPVGLDLPLMACNGHKIWYAAFFQPLAVPLGPWVAGPWGQESGLGAHQTLTPAPTLAPALALALALALTLNLALAQPQTLVGLKERTFFPCRIVPRQPHSTKLHITTFSTFIVE